MLILEKLVFKHFCLSLFNIFTKLYNSKGHIHDTSIESISAGKQGTEKGVNARTITQVEPPQCGSE